MLPDGRVLVVSGDQNSLNDIAATSEVYERDRNTWTSLPQAANAIPVYPFMFVLPDGRHSSGRGVRVATTTQVLNLSTLTWSVVDGRGPRRRERRDVSAGKILKADTAATAATAASLRDRVCPGHEPAQPPSGSRPARWRIRDRS